MIPVLRFRIACAAPPRRMARLSRCMRPAAPVLLLLLLLGACAAPRPLPEPPLPYPPAARERMLRIALAEWIEGGGVVVARGQRPPTRRAESDPANFPRILAYW